MHPYFEREIYPPLSGVRRFGLDQQDTCGNVRALIEAQAVSMRIHSEWMGVRTTSICMTGGASANQDILRVFADVYQARVHQFETTNSAALGAVIRALYSSARAHGQDLSWQEAAGPYTRPVPGSQLDPDPAQAGTYDKLVRQYWEYEQQALQS